MPTGGGGGTLAGMSDANINDGGPAFPVPYNHQAAGISMRDWFAGQALAGLLARDLISDSAGGKSVQWANVRDDESYRIPYLAYQYADAMLAARNKK